MPRRKDIEAAIAAYNDADRGMLLPPEAARLLSVMFHRGSVCQIRLEDLVLEGFDKRTLQKLLRSLVDAGFLSKGLDHADRRGPTTYHLHLPPLVQR